MKDISGFLVIDKPAGITSHGVVEQVRKLLPKKVKVGHTGTLDPLATGLLILAVGKATRFSRYLIKQDKCYFVRGRLGLSSDTYDIDGNVKEIECPEIKKEDIERVIQDFKGEISQVPPPFSAVKIKGKRAYELARRGEVFEIKARTVKVYSINLTLFEYPDFTLEVCCSSGTYVRPLIHDIGKALGCDAVVVELRRTRIGSISLEEAITIEELKKKGVEKFLVPIEKILPFPSLSLDEREAKRFRNGVKLKSDLEEGFYKILSPEGFIGVGKASKGYLKPETVLLNVNSSKLKNRF
ncbi:MAG: tRNA pseudouridine(55) synthase TruB [Desulfurobacteriaceae bacterium]